MANFFDYLDSPQTKKKASVQEQTDQALGSTFELETGTAPTVTQDIPELPPKKVTNFDELAKPENLKSIRDYAEARFGESGKQGKNESTEDYIKRWMTGMRQVDWNTTLNAVPELNWIYNAKDEDVVKAAKAHALYDTVPDWYEKGGQGGVRPFAEATLSAISEPTDSRLPLSCNALTMSSSLIH